MYEIKLMNGNELLKKLRKLAKDRQLRFELVKSHGKGSHSTLKIENNKTTIKDLKKEIGPGLLSKMLFQLGIDKKDI